MKTEKTARRFHVTKSVETAEGFVDYQVAEFKTRQEAVALILSRERVHGTTYYVNGRTVYQDEK